MSQSCCLLLCYNGHLITSCRSWMDYGIILLQLILDMLLSSAGFLTLLDIVATRVHRIFPVIHEHKTVGGKSWIMKISLWVKVRRLLSESARGAASFQLPTDRMLDSADRKNRSAMASRTERRLHVGLKINMRMR